jgi:hypothetical protein
MSFGAVGLKVLKRLPLQHGEHVSGTSRILKFYCLLAPFDKGSVPRFVPSYERWPPGRSFGLSPGSTPGNPLEMHKTMSLSVAFVPHR